MEIDEIDGNNGNIYRLKNIDEIQEMLTAGINERNLVQNITAKLLFA